MNIDHLQVPDTCAELTEDLWRIEFDAAINGSWQHCWIDNTPRSNAERFIRNWRAGCDELAIFCSDCPLEDNARCPHGAPALPYGEIRDARILPMCDVV